MECSKNSTIHAKIIMIALKLCNKKYKNTIKNLLGFMNFDDSVVNVKVAAFALTVTKALSSFVGQY